MLVHCEKEAESTSNLRCFHYRYVSLLENVRSTYGIDSFKFDAGEVNYVTSIPFYKTHKEMDNVGYYTQFYAECASR